MSSAGSCGLQQDRVLEYHPDPSASPVLDALESDRPHEITPDQWLSFLYATPNTVALKITGDVIDSFIFSDDGELYAVTQYTSQSATAPSETTESRVRDVVTESVPTVVAHIPSVR